MKDQLHNKNDLSAGFAKVNITPDYPCGLGGYGRPGARVHDSVADPIYVTCIALSDGDETILVYTADLQTVNPTYSDSIRDCVFRQTGIPKEKIFISATHSHSAPTVYGYPNAERWLDDLHNFFAQAATLALADRAPATIYAGVKELSGLNFVRHYLMEDGTYTGPNFGRWKDNTPINYSGKPDSNLGLVEFRREAPKQNILLVNWQGHPDRAKELGFTSIAPSYIGPLRDTLQDETGCLVAYFTGADGNMNTESRIEKDKLCLSWREYGAKIAQQAASLYQELAPIGGSGICTIHHTYEAEIDHSWDHLIDVANEIDTLFRAEGRDAANIEAKKYNMSSCYQANAIIWRHKSGKTRPTELYAFRVGNLGFVSCEFEIFSEAGLYIRENSPFPMTMILTSNHGYLPSQNAYNYRCYEADIGLYTPGILERLAETMVNMLDTLYKKEDA